MCHRSLSVMKSSVLMRFVFFAFMREYCLLLGGCVIAPTLYYLRMSAVMVVSSEAMEIQMAGVVKVLPTDTASRLRLLLGDT